MDKKRRKKTSPTTNKILEKPINSLYSITTLNQVSEQCGITSKKHTFLETYGSGTFEIHQFDGLSIMIFDAVFKRDIVLEGYIPDQFLELSFLIEGEQIIKIEGLPQDLIYEGQECYFLYLSAIKGTISYRKRKSFKEVKIRMTMNFIKRHRLDAAYNILENYSLLKVKNDFLRPLCPKTQEILSEILTDQRKGLLKRLFLESKTLELIALKLETPTTTKTKTATQSDHLIKKLYQTQHIISSDLSVQYSIQQLSKKVGLNDFVLKKEFKQLFGKTIFEYATELRMKKAKQLLQHSTKPIYEISELVGYKNSTHFTAAFKKIERITPKVYRNNTKKNV